MKRGGAGGWTSRASEGERKREKKKERRGGTV